LKKRAPAGQAKRRQPSVPTTSLSSGRGPREENGQFPQTREKVNLRKKQTMNGGVSGPTSRSLEFSPQQNHKLKGGKCSGQWGFSLK